ncbi:hypothetical protein LA02_1533 [Francisella philomiragia]|uniref:hypothetical protein n=1 Tax=Francisella philomiragia TaxID=28110 RepID=UPI0005A55F89|nr:hypothetical protein [Francisella philomiragia]AJI56213.1 hypothetical protein LA02_1533 [Francisella philomiragia]
MKEHNSIKEFLTPNVEVIQRAIDSYIFNQNKASIFDWQLFHHHGQTGIKRAKILSEWVRRAEYVDQLQIFLYNYLHNKNATVILSQLKDIAYKINLRSDINLIKEAKKLSEGNDTTSSLRTYIKNAYNSVFVDNEFISRRKSIFNNLFKTSQHQNSSLFVFRFEELGKLTKTSKTSAHEIKVYENNIGTSYFMKCFNISSREYKKNISNGIAEVVYSQIWRYLIGERSSESRLVSENNKIIGICSKGLNKFVEYGKMTDKDKLNTKGLVSILVFIYLLMEDDFHIFNYGQAKFDDSYYFAKIDHDYIVDKWHILSKNNTKFCVLKLSQILKEKNLSDLINLLAANCRFTPGSTNSFFLRASHSIRSVFTDRKITTTPSSMSAFFRSNLITLNNVNEFKATIDFVRKRSDNVEGNLTSKLSNLLSTFEKEYPDVNTEKAREILKYFTNRMQRLSKSINSN